MLMTSLTLLFFDKVWAQVLLELISYSIFIHTKVYSVPWI